jgi:hypothetical protein
MDGMVEYRAEFIIDVLPQDQDVMLLVPDMIVSRFQGTCLRVSHVTVTNQEPVAIGPDNPKLAAAIIKKQEETE